MFYICNCIIVILYISRHVVRVNKSYLILSYLILSYPVDALPWAALTTEAKTNVGRCVAYSNAIILEDTNSPVRRLPKMRGSND